MEGVRKRMEGVGNVLERIFEVVDVWGGTKG